MDNATTQARKPLTRSQLKNREAMEGLIKGIAIFIIIGVATFAEVAFLSLIGKMFPDNVIFKAGAILGAVATGASAVTLLFAKLKWIRAGHQHWISWAFLVVELTIMLLNLVISFQLAGGSTPTHLDPYLYSYYQIMPATPLVALIGWTFIFMTDRQKEMDDARRDMSDELEEAEMDHVREQHQVMMQLRRDITHIHANQVRGEVEKRIPDIERITAEIVANEIGSMIGMYIPRVMGSREVESTITPVQLAQTASTALPPAGKKVDRPNASPESDTSNKRGILGRIRDGVNAAMGAPAGQDDAIIPEAKAESEVKPAKAPRPFLDQSASTTKPKQLPKFDAHKSARRNRRAARRSAHRSGNGGAGTGA